MIYKVIFPTEIWMKEIDYIDNKELKNVILEKEKVEPYAAPGSDRRLSPKQISNVGGWQSADDLVDDVRFSNIVECVKESFIEVSNKNNYKDELEMYVDNMWANINRYKDFNMSHIHGESDWSFCYYVSVPQNSGNIVFSDPRLTRVSRPRDSFLKNFNNDFQHGTYGVSPSDGELIIFPSYLEHSVENNESNEPRISVSGNIILRM